MAEADARDAAKGAGDRGGSHHPRPAVRRRGAAGRTADRHRGRGAAGRPAAPVRGGGRRAGGRTTRCPERPGRAGRRAPLVLVGDDAARRVRGAARRRGVVLVGRDQDDSGVWRRAVEIGADHVLMLPDGEQWLVDRIADVAEGVGRPALTVGVIGGRGGAGASTLACALAVTSARAGTAHPARRRATRWAAAWTCCSAARAPKGCAGRPSPPRAAGSAAAPWRSRCPNCTPCGCSAGTAATRVAVPPQAVRAVLAAARRRGGAVVVDLPRRVDEGVAEALAQLDLGAAGGPRRAARRRGGRAGWRPRSAWCCATCGSRSAGRTRPGWTTTRWPGCWGCRWPARCPSKPGLPAAATAEGAAAARAARERAAPLARFCDARSGQRALAEAGRRMDGVRGDRARDVRRRAAGRGAAVARRERGRADARRGWRRPCGRRGGCSGTPKCSARPSGCGPSWSAAGPLEPLLADPSVTDVLVSAPDRVWVDRGGGLELTGGLLPGRGRRATARAAAGRRGRAAAGRRPAVGGRPAARTAPGCTRCCRRWPSAPPACRCGSYGRGRSPWPSWWRRGRCRRAATGCCGRCSTPGCRS